MTNTQRFHRVIANNLIASFANSYIWFAITFWVYLETKSVLATSWIGGIFVVANLVSSFYFGHVVDHTRKEVVMRYSSIASLALYALAALVYFQFPPDTWTDPRNVTLWTFIILSMCGSVMGGLRNIALSTTVSILVPEARDKANGLVGMSFGIAFALTSVVSGTTIGFFGMGVAMLITIAATLAALLHLAFVDIPETLAHHEDAPKPKLNVRQTIGFILAVPGLMSLLVLNTVNNFLGGVFTALLDAYGLSLVSVEVWGFMWGAVSLVFILSGLWIAKYGIGKSPLKTMLLLNTLSWLVCIIFPIQASVTLLLIGMTIWLAISPAIEAAEQTLMQTVVPHEHQGRVFGFAQSMESAATPLTVFLIGPIAQLVFIPFMTTGMGTELIGSWFGTGAARGIALVFIFAGLIGTVLMFIAFKTRAYALLKERYSAAKAGE